MFCKKRLVERRKRQPFLKERKISINVNLDIKIEIVLFNKIERDNYKILFFMCGFESVLEA